MTHIVARRILQRMIEAYEDLVKPVSTRDRRHLSALKTAVEALDALIEVSHTPGRKRLIRVAKLDKET